jgi:hypothetical protein
LAVAAAGCGGPLHPVEGQVLLNGKPLQGKTGAVVLRPDASKGNDSTAAPFGQLKPDGSYSVATDGKPGAPPGWYKVILMVTDPADNPNEEPRRVLHRRYETEADTPLAIEVVASPGPGSYDLQLSR